MAVKTWSVGEVLTATDLNGAFTEVQQAPFSRRERGTTATTITTGTQTALSLNNLVTSNPEDAFTETSTTVTIVTAGVYQIEAGCQWESNATGYRYLAIRAGGSIVAASRVTPAGFPWEQNVSAAVRLLAGHTVQVEVLQTSGADLTIVNGALTFRTITWVRP